MPFVATLLPDQVNNANGSNWDLGGGASDMIDAVDTQDAKWYGRDDPTDPDGGNASATCYVQALAAHIRRITASATAPPVRVRGWWYELNPGGPMTAFHGAGYSASSDLSADLSVSGGTSYEETAHDIAQNPDGPRNWEVTDFPGGGAGAWLAITAQRPTVLGEGIYCDHVRLEVRWERDQQGLILLDVLLPWIQLGAITQAFGGLAHAKLDPRRIEAWARRASHQAAGWDADCDQDVLAGLRAWRWPVHFDLGRRTVRA